jgi:transcriptional regulator with XRE-family HTH domain
MSAAKTEGAVTGDATGHRPGRAPEVVAAIGTASRRHDLGEFIRDQRRTARLSLRKLSELAGISNPYLSQIERGLRKPSAEILQAIAKGLRISAETLYVRAGILDERGEGPDLETEILGDHSVTERQKQALIEIYRSFQAETAAERAREVAAFERGTPG